MQKLVKKTLTGETKQAVNRVHQFHIDNTLNGTNGKPGYDLRGIILGQYRNSST